ncbi:MAG: VOC family protein [Pseudomonadota bacterium]
MIASLKTKISTPLISETRAFYERAFGMSVLEEWDDADDRGVILVPPGGRTEALLEIYYCEKATDLSGVSLQFKVSSVSEFKAALPDDVDFTGPTPRPWGATYLYLKDPAGVAVIVYEGCW